MKTLTFSINGEFITKFSREMYFFYNKEDDAIKLLKGSLVTDMLTEPEREALAIDILAGRKKIVGISNTPSYTVVDMDDKETRDFESWISTNQDAYRKYLNFKYNSYRIVDDTTKPRITNFDIGWLSPDGTFYRCDYGSHVQWATHYLTKSADKKYIDPIYADRLVYYLNWIMIDSPQRDYPRITRDESKLMTKAQKEFLYDYYMNNKMRYRANELYN